MASIVVVVVIITVIAIILSRKKADASTDFPYQKIESLLTPAERLFMGVLSQVVDGKTQIFVKVRVADVAKPKAGMSRSDWQKNFNKISAKHFDFLICNKDDLSAICAVELNDKSHSSASRQKRDRFLEGMCASIGVPLIQVPARASYAVNEITQLLASHLNLPAGKSQLSGIPINDVKVVRKLCPKCSSSLVERIAKQGNHAGQTFWACSAYPKCKYTEDTSV